MPGDVTVLLFAQARVAVGRGRLRREVSAEGVPLRVLLDRLATEFPPLRPVLRVSRIYVNQRPAAGASISLRPGDEVALHPPYSGG